MVWVWSNGLDLGVQGASSFFLFPPFFLEWEEENQYKKKNTDKHQSPKTKATTLRYHQTTNQNKSKIP